MITVVLFHSAGERETVLVPGNDQAARAEARQLIWDSIADDDHTSPRCDVYRGCTFDVLSQRFTFDSDATWYTPRTGDLGVAA